MGDAVKPGNGGEAPPVPAEDPLLVELRGLLLAAEKKDVTQIQERLDDPQSRAEDISHVLPEAIAIRSRRDRDLTDSLLPAVEEAIGISVRRHPDVLVDGLFPVMGPAIRKSITNTLAEMLESLNQTLAIGFSKQGLKWRLEAWRTGKPFAQVVLLRTLLYRVEQVFLIHRETGLLLCHVSAPGAAVQDASMVSGMLTAIRDFVGDSFGSAGAGGLDAFRVGELDVWVEQGPRAVLAAVIRGTPPKELRAVFTEAIEKIHRDHAGDLEEFAGDAAPFERSRGVLEECLKSQKQPAEEKAARRRGLRRYAPVLGVFAVLAAAIGFWVFTTVRRNERFERYVRSLAAQPGIVVTASGRRGGKFFVEGLRDPLAADPAPMAAAAKLDPKEVVGSWKPYRALDPPIVVARARTFLSAPESVSLRVDGATLVAAGSAPARWIQESRRLSRSIPDVSSYDDRGVSDTDHAGLDRLRKAVESRRVFFARGSSELAAAESERIAQASREIGELGQAASAAGMPVRVEVVGRGDSEGTTDVNLSLSRKRAEKVQAALGVPPAGVALAATGVGASQPLVEEKTDQDRQVNRSVSFRVILPEPK
ncbi:MAG TPA: OmpA family protein [Thermoanaerobaculia bacterium]|nr:OmpA family protein [Thermoanaerobaculia bacterium]